MKVFILCGGSGVRFDSIYPKPLNLINGFPMIYHVLNKIDYNNIYILYNVRLDKYGFKQYLINTFSNKSFNFIHIDYQTRGAAESLYIGLKNIDINEQILVLDNDNIYDGLDFNNLPQDNFILYNNNQTGLTHYSFVELNETNDKVIKIEERVPITNYICLGGYCFKNTDICKQYCKKVILSSNDECEPFLSKVFSEMLLDNITVNAHYLSKVFSIGTPKDVLINKDKLPKQTLRIVFDLDNTIVTYPNNYKDYKSVSINESIVNFINYLKNEGHYIIIYTARNMVTCKDSIGKVIKNIGKITLDNLNDLNVYYDEIHFGKPYGDIYIDDKAFNCYDLSLYSQMGFYNYEVNNYDDFKTNKYNKIKRLNKNSIQKYGKDLQGEIYFYNTILLSGSPIYKLMPKIISHDNNNSIIMEYINGTILYKIYCEDLLHESLLYKLLYTINNFHNSDINDNTIISNEDIYHHYYDKFIERSNIIDDFQFEDIDVVKTIIYKQIGEFINKNYPINNIIHGDLWFSNIFFLKGSFVLFDFRGKINNKLTIKGHTFYDWAKIYQSIIGLDSIINYGVYIDNNIKQKISNAFWSYLISNNIIHESDKNYIIKLTGYLIYNTFHFYENDFSIERKNMIWNLVKECIYI
jgi:capsule biosynthesis phosphatase